jgi:4-hydroxythreonine-4-phosphate dehydrogenase
MSKTRIAVTIGDPQGIGPEIVLKALCLHPEIFRHCQPVVFGNSEFLEEQADICRIPAKINPVDVSHMKLPDEPGVINLVTVSDESPQSVHIPSGRLAFNYIESAISAALEGKVSAMATAPINKENMRLAGVPYLDHTEILEQLTGSSQTMTLFITGKLRIFFYSRHIAFRDIVAALQPEKLLNTLQACNDHLKKIGIEKPKLALAALNPHGGEEGMFGDEETSILIPAVVKARKEGLTVEGPIPADSVFHLALEGMYDGVLSLYHDQGHIAAKTYDFYKTISLSMGLPFLRTSVDHGTAENLAGKNKANETSMVEAIVAAARYAW